ncbi:hypothetical protein ABFX02_14G130400 [Erythranthe guttata]
MLSESSIENPKFHSDAVITTAWEESLDPRLSNKETETDSTLNLGYSLFMFEIRRKSNIRILKPSNPQQISTPKSLSVGEQQRRRSGAGGCISAAAAAGWTFAAEGRPKRTP